MPKLNANYEIISDKSKNPVTSTAYIKHGDTWLDGVIEGKASVDYVNDVIDNIESHMATIDESTGKIPSSQLPSYVDDVLEFANKAAFPVKGEEGKIYVDKATNLTWRWSGSTYVEISQSLALGETSSTAYAGNKGKQVADNLAAHTGNTTAHITAAEREKWNKNSDGNVVVANVKSFGAKGDGIANDTWRVAEAITYAKTNNCTLYFPKGTYLINSFGLWDDAVIEGEDMNSTILKMNPEIAMSFLYTPVNSENNNVTIKNLTLDGYDNQKSGSGIAYKGFRLYLENLTVRGFSAFGIKAIRPEENYAGKHGHMKDLMLYDNKNGNMYYEGETDNNFYNIMAYHNAGIEPEYNIKIASAGCRIFGMHLWGLADVSLVNAGYGCTYAGCHIEGGKTAKIDVYKAMEFYGRIYHHTGDDTNRVTAIRAMDSLYASTFIFDANLIYALFDLNNKWVSNVHVNANVNMVSDKLFLHNTFGVKDNVYINWGYNDTQYVWAIDNKRKVDTYKDVESVIQNANEVHYNGAGARTFAVNAGDENSTGYVTVVPGTGNAQISATSVTEDNVNLRLTPKGNGTVEIRHTCIYGANYDDFNKTGFYEALGSTTQPTTNSPNGSEKNNNFYVLVQKRSDTYISQTAFSARSDMLVYQRVCSNGVWTEWTRFVKGSDISIVGNGPEWNSESYARIYQSPKDDIILLTARMRNTIGGSPTDLDELVDTTVDYYNWNNSPTSANYPAHTPADMPASPFHMKVTHTRPEIIVQELTPDNAQLVGATYYRRGVGKGTEDSPYVWEEWTASQNTVPMSRLNHLGVDYNSLTTVGMYIAQGTTTQPTQNSPDGNNTNNNYVVIVGNPEKSTTYFTQTAYSVRSDARIFHRTCSGGVWSPWIKIAKESDIEAIEANMSTLESNVENVVKLVDGTTQVKAKPAMVILDFDQDIEPNDVRISIMEQYGWKPSFSGATTKALTQELVNKGWDLSTYNYNNPPTDAQLSEDSTTALNACMAYVKAGLDKYEANGFYNPVSWSCKQMKYGPTLGKALKYYGYKIARGVPVGEQGSWFAKDIMKEDFTATPYYAIYTGALAGCKTQIQNAIANNGVVNIFTHYVVNDASQDRGYDCTKAVFLELMEYIKNLENEGKLIVTNYGNFYKMCYPWAAYELDCDRASKTTRALATDVNAMSTLFSLED